ncbi:MAG: hypothetical protein ABS921_03140, partial [Psychrobacter alimentarius]
LKSLIIFVVDRAALYRNTLFYLRVNNAYSTTIHTNLDGNNNEKDNDKFTFSDHYVFDSG